MVWLRLNLAILLVAEIFVVVLASLQGMFALFYGSLRQERLVWAYIIIAGLFAVCVAVTFRQWRIHPLWIWMRAPALLLATYATLVAVDPGARWGGGEAMPKPEIYHHARGVGFANRGDYQRAIAAYTEAIRFNSQYPDAYYSRGIARESLGDQQGKIGDFQEAARLGNSAAKTWLSKNGYRW